LDCNTLATATFVSKISDYVYTICCACGSFETSDVLINGLYCLGTLCMPYQRPQILNGLFSKTYTDNTPRNKHQLDLMAQGILATKKAPIQRITLSIIDPWNIWSNVDLGDTVTLGDGELIGLYAGAEVRVTGFTFGFSEGNIYLELYCNDPETKTYAANNINYSEETNTAQKSKTQDPIRKNVDESTNTGTSYGMDTSQQTVSFGMKQIKQVADPTENFDAANKKYVDTHGGGGGSSPWCTSGSCIRPIAGNINCDVFVCRSLCVNGDSYFGKCGTGADIWLEGCESCVIAETYLRAPGGSIALGSYAYGGSTPGSIQANDFWADCINGPITGLWIKGGGALLSNLATDLGADAARWGTLWINNIYGYNMGSIACPLTSVNSLSYTGDGSGLSNIVKSLNSLTGALNLVAGANITITPSGTNITIASTGGAGTNCWQTGANPSYITPCNTKYICANQISSPAGIIDGQYVTASSCMCTPSLSFANTSGGTATSRIWDSVGLLSDLCFQAKTGMYFASQTALGGMVLHTNFCTFRPTINCTLGAICQDLGMTNFPWRNIYSSGTSWLGTVCAWDAVCVAGGSGILCSTVVRTTTVCATNYCGNVVSSLSSCVGSLTLSAGTGISIGCSGGTFTICAPGGTNCWTNGDSTYITPCNNCNIATAPTGIFCGGYAALGYRVTAPCISFNCTSNRIFDSGNDIYICGRCGIYAAVCDPSSACNSGFVFNDSTHPCSIVSVRPYTTNATDLGASSYKWRDIYLRDSCEYGPYCIPASTGRLLGFTVCCASSRVFAISSRGNDWASVCAVTVRSWGWQASNCICVYLANADGSARCVYVNLAIFPR
jgi:hypothetical protein